MSYSSYFWYSGVILGTDTIQYDTIAIEMLKLHSPGLLGAQTLPRRSAAECACHLSQWWCSQQDRYYTHGSSVATAALIITTQNCLIQAVFMPAQQQRELATIKRCSNDTRYSTSY